MIAVAATTKTQWITDTLDKGLDPERDEAISTEAQKLLDKCIEQLSEKERLLKTRMASIEPNGVISIIRLKWEWELIYLNRMANEACRLSSDQSLSGERLAVDALELPAEVPCTPSGSKMSVAHFLKL